MIGWVRREGYALVDVNLYPKPVEVHNVTVSYSNGISSAVLIAVVFPAQSQGCRRQRPRCPGVSLGQLHPVRRHRNLYLLWGLITHRLSSAQKVVLIAHGPGCRPLADFLKSRATGAMKMVKGVVEVVGLQHMPQPAGSSNNEELREWFPRVGSLHFR